MKMKEVQANIGDDLLWQREVYKTKYKKTVRIGRIRENAH